MIYCCHHYNINCSQSLQSLESYEKSLNCYISPLFLLSNASAKYFHRIMFHDYNKYLFCFTLLIFDVFGEMLAYQEFSGYKRLRMNVFSRIKSAAGM